MERISQRQGERGADMFVFKRHVRSTPNLRLVEMLGEGAARVKDARERLAYWEAGYALRRVQVIADAMARAPSE
jgi:hypothetical protein